MFFIIFIGGSGFLSLDLYELRVICFFDFFMFVREVNIVFLLYFDVYFILGNLMFLIILSFGKVKFFDFLILWEELIEVYFFDLVNVLL